MIEWIIGGISTFVAIFAILVVFSIMEVWIKWLFRDRKED